MQAMQVNEALANADEWIKGVMLYEGAQGWRVACATLAAEVRRLRALARCGCGDTFTEHDPGTCGNCLAGMDGTGEVAQLRHHLTELAKCADKAAMVLATIEAEDTTEGEMLQEIIDGISRWAPDALMGPNDQAKGREHSERPA